MTRVKICGITRSEDAEHAAAAGAWALGFILWPGSPRACDPAVAAGIVRSLRRQVELVGVFVTPTLDEVVRAADSLGLTMLQLHGDVGPTFCEVVARRTGIKVIRAVNVASGADLQDLERYRMVDLHLIDGRTPGGGETWDWSLAARHKSRVPVVLSGGLTADNVADGIAAVAPYAVDVASGVEAAPGIKDHAKVEAFIAAASPPEPEPEQQADAEPAEAEAS